MLSPKLSHGGLEAGFAAACSEPLQAALIAAEGKKGCSGAAIRRDGGLFDEAERPEAGQHTRKKDGCLRAVTAVQNPRRPPLRRSRQGGGKGLEENHRWSATHARSCKPTIIQQVRLRLDT